jgi:PAS domain S-box-containing protein
MIANRRPALAVKKRPPLPPSSNQKKNATYTPRNLSPTTSDPDRELLLTHAMDAFVAYDRDLRYTYINPAGADLLGHPPAEIIGRTNRELIGPGADTIEPYLEQVLKGKKQVSVMHEIPLPTGARCFDTTYTPVMDEAGEVLRILGICRDETQRETRLRQEKESQQSRHRELLANLAGGLAHQFNNALSAVMGNLDLLNLDLMDLDAILRQKLTRYTDRIQESLERMGYLTRQLLAYAEGGRYKPDSVSMSTFVRYTLPLLGHTLQPSVRVETELPSGGRNVEADITQLQMVLSAILSNAYEAVEEGGGIRITVRDVDYTAQDAERPQELKPGPYVCLVVEDDGVGMDEATRARIFEPFFSTKFQGRGLGMAAAYGVIRNHGGWISVESSPGQGTRVTIWLPAIQEEETEERSRDVQEPVRAATILVIEDEEAVQEVFQTTLARMGYQVLTASTGREALKLAKNFSETIDLAILDILLPDMDGRSLYPLLMQVRPGLKVMVSSGYALQGPAQEILNAGAQAFLPKPFSLSKFREALQDVLGVAPPLLRDSPGQEEDEKGDS